MQVRVRTEWVNVPDLEKMLHKVPWALGEVSLYACVARVGPRAMRAWRSNFTHTAHIIEGSRNIAEPAGGVATFSAAAML